MGFRWESGAGSRCEQFLNLDHLDDADDRLVTLRCVALGATYHAYNAIRHWPHRLSEEEAYRSVNQGLREMVLDDKGLARLVDTIWSH